MFGYKVYRAFDGLIKHDMMYNDDKSNVFVKNRFDLRDLIEETLSLIAKENILKIESIELAEIFITLLSSNIQIKNLNNES